MLLNNCKLYSIKFKTDKKILCEVDKLHFWNKPYKLLDEEYEFWIEFRISENRFWYGERIPVLNSNGHYEYKTNFIMTKNGLEKSIEIVKNIKSRFSMVYSQLNYNYTNIRMDVEEDSLPSCYRLVEMKNPNINFFNKFSNHKKKEENKKSFQEEISGLSLFLNN